MKPLKLRVAEKFSPDRLLSPAIARWVHTEARPQPVNDPRCTFIVVVHFTACVLRVRVCGGRRGFLTTFFVKYIRYKFLRQYIASLTAR